MKSPFHTPEYRPYTWFRTVCLGSATTGYCPCAGCVQEWTREKMGDLWLGFDAGELEGLMRASGLSGVMSETIDVEGGLPLVACGGTKGGA